MLSVYNFSLGSQICRSMLAISARHQDNSCEQLGFVCSEIALTGLTLTQFHSNSPTNSFSLLQSAGKFFLSLR